jgi:hypothetical protein
MEQCTITKESHVLMMVNKEDKFVPVFMHYVMGLYEALH